MVESQKNLKGYMFIWAGQSISLLGSAIVQFAIIWWLTIETKSPIILTLATFAGFLPMLLFSPVAGVVADRWSRKHVMLMTDVMQAAATLGLVSLFILDIAGILHVLVLLAFRGTFQAFQMPAKMAIAPMMVPKDKISRLNALNSVFNSLIHVISPGIGALLLGVTNVANILWLDVFTFIPAALALVLVFIPDHRSELSNKKESSFSSDFKEGFSYIKGSPLLSAIVLGTIFNIFATPLFSLLPLFVVDIHLGSSADFAIVESLFHVGLLVGSLTLIIMKAKEPKVNNLIVGMFILLLSLMSLSFVPVGNILLFGIVVLVGGAMVAFIDVQILSLLQTTVPKELQGRVLSTTIIIVKSIYTFALIFAGIIAELVSIPVLFVVSPLVTVIIAVIIITKTDIMEMARKSLTKVDVPELEIVQAVN
ncbi:MAG: MFS transporter [Candidatus Hodarchaeales archaeon]|jgi:DHA3 family macrolide efflux protein-like MFS transporter